jgi:hypothetical protein
MIGKSTYGGKIYSMLSSKIYNLKEDRFLLIYTKPLKYRILKLKYIS